MGFLRQKFFNDPDEIAWILSTHLKGKMVPDFASFMLHGSDDHPAQLDLYAAVRPEYNQHPVTSFTRDDEGNLHDPSAPNYVPRKLAVKRTKFGPKPAETSKVVKRSKPAPVTEVKAPNLTTRRTKRK